VALMLDRGPLYASIMMEPVCWIKVPLPSSCPPAGEFARVTQHAWCTGAGKAAGTQRLLTRMERLAAAARSNAQDDDEEMY
jgi:hypothetical protein